MWSVSCTSSYSLALKYCAAFKPMYTSVRLQSTHTRQRNSDFMPFSVLFGSLCSDQGMEVGESCCTSPDVSLWLLYFIHHEHKNGHDWIYFSLSSSFLIVNQGTQHVTSSLRGLSTFSLNWLIIYSIFGDSKRYTSVMRVLLIWRYFCHLESTLKW